MKQTRAIHAALKRQLKARGRNYADVAGVLGLSEASVKRLFAQAELSLERMERVCDWIGVELADLVEASKAEQPALTELEPAQERELLADPSLLLVCFLVLNRWREADILETFRFSKPELTLRLIRLERLGLIELMPFDRIKLRTARNFAWRADGPIQRNIVEKVLPEFIAARFDAPGERMHFVGGLLSRTSMHKLQEAMADLARRLDELVEQDLALPTSERHGVSLFIGVRPWEYSVFSKWRRVRRPPFA